METQKKVIGLTGVFGSGKSTVTKLFEKEGALVVDADQLAHEVWQKDHPLYGELVKLFEDDLQEEICPKRVAAIVFQDEAKRKALEALIHPYVRERIEEESNKEGEKTVVAEIPLLFEAGFQDVCRKVIVVSATDEAILKRLQEKGFTVEQIQARLAAQMPLDEKKERADFVIENKGSHEDLATEVKKVWKELIS